ncbi:Os04g0622400, partial [Oryza sativa Japonica Group]
AASASPPPCAYPTAVARRLLHQRRRLLTPTPLPSLSSAPPSPPAAAAKPTPPPTSPRAYHPLLSRSVADLLRRCPAIDLRRRNSVACRTSPRSASLQDWRHGRGRRSRSPIGIAITGDDIVASNLRSCLHRLRRC